MPRVNESISINAPVEKVFAYVENPVNRPEFWPSLVEVKDIERLPNGGTKLRWVYKMAGVRSEGTGETIDYIPNRRVVDENKGGVSSTIAWNVEPEGDGTKMTFEGDYDVHLPVLRKLALSFLVRLNEQEAKTLLANIKAKMEEE
jgi:uncharacterized protein YndB with AHSA1/START domain